MESLLKSGQIRKVEIGNYYITYQNSRFIVRQLGTNFLVLESSVNTSYDWVRDYTLKLSNICLK